MATPRTTGNVPGSSTTTIAAVRALVGLVVGCALLATAGCGGSSPSPTTTTGAQAGCADVATPSPRTPQGLTPPARQLDATRRYELRVDTSCGTFVVLLQPRTSPRATASLFKLATGGYFDDTIFHRIVPGFVIQGGDPTQTGAGGPGYSTVDPPKAGTHYVEGMVAMAKAGNEPRGAAGSQFFVMTADAPTLGPDYAVVGRVISGMPVVRLIGTFGDASDPAGTPTRTVVIRHVVAIAR
jgi:cyclophilin family peptidyl-prolyl cis-trans isomerase